MGSSNAGGDRYGVLGRTARHVPVWYGPAVAKAGRSKAIVWYDNGTLEALRDEPAVVSVCMV